MIPWWAYTWNGSSIVLNIQYINKRIRMNNDSFGTSIEAMGPVAERNIILLLVCKLITETKGRIRMKHHYMLEEWRTMHRMNGYIWKGFNFYLFLFDNVNEIGFRRRLIDCCVSWYVLLGESRLECVRGFAFIFLNGHVSCSLSIYCTGRESESQYSERVSRVSNSGELALILMIRLMLACSHASRVEILNHRWKYQHPGTQTMQNGTVLCP